MGFGTPVGLDHSNSWVGPLPRYLRGQARGKQEKPARSACTVNSGLNVHGREQP